MPADPSTFIHLTYADLMEDCPERPSGNWGGLCNNGHIYSPAWAAWNVREHAARTQWENDHPGSFDWYTTAESKALEEEVPEGPEEWECDTCHGTGLVPNATGRAILALVHWSKR